MKIKTSELSGAALDYAVFHTDPHQAGFSAENKALLLRGYRPSTNWAVGGPLIESEKVSIERCNDLHFPKGNERGDYYEPYYRASTESGAREYGPAALIAACRCIVAAHLGDEVEIPDNLINRSDRHHPPTATEPGGSAL